MYSTHTSTLGGIVVRTSKGIYEYFDNIEDAEKFADEMNRAYARGYKDAEEDMLSRIEPSIRNLNEAVKHIRK